MLVTTELRQLIDKRRPKQGVIQQGAGVSQIL